MRKISFWVPMAGAVLAANLWAGDVSGLRMMATDPADAAFTGSPVLRPDSVETGAGDHLEKPSGVSQGAPALRAPASDPDPADEKRKRDLYTSAELGNVIGGGLGGGLVGLAIGASAGFAGAVLGLAIGAATGTLLFLGAWTLVEELSTLRR